MSFDAIKSVVGPYAIQYDPSAPQTFRVVIAAVGNIGNYPAGE